MIAERDSSSGRCLVYADANGLAGSIGMANLHGRGDVDGMARHRSSDGSVKTKCEKIRVMAISGQAGWVPLLSGNARKKMTCAHANTLVLQFVSDVLRCTVADYREQGSR